MKIRHLFPDARCQARAQAPGLRPIKQDPCKNDTKDVENKSLSHILRALAYRPARPAFLISSRVALTSCLTSLSTFSGLVASLVPLQSSLF
jgi:hypothetical protein